jgi:aminoglycoside phosphotransferase (APT) family kinase protein
MQPLTVIHGEFYASNVLIDDGIDGIRVCPVDWERAAIGPALIDLAALTGGNWTEEQKRDMVEEYRIERQRLGFSVPHASDLLRQFELCRFQLAVQWLGWSGDWSPPREHQQDWIAEAIGAACRCGYVIR